MHSTFNLTLLAGIAQIIPNYRSVHGLKLEDTGESHVLAITTYDTGNFWTLWTMHLESILQTDNGRRSARRV